MRREKQRRQAATEIWKLHNAMKKPMALSTIYRGIRRLPNGNWHYTGRGYDYTA